MHMKGTSSFGKPRRSAAAAIWQQYRIRSAHMTTPIPTGRCQNAASSAPRCQFDCTMLPMPNPPAQPNSAKCCAEPAPVASRPFLIYRAAGSVRRSSARVVVDGDEDWRNLRPCQTSAVIRYPEQGAGPPTRSRW